MCIYIPYYTHTTKIASANIVREAKEMWENIECKALFFLSENRCEAPAEFLNGKAVLDNTTSGPSLLFSCHRGYTLEGSPEAHCTENGTWSHLVPLCKRVC